MSIYQHWQNHKGKWEMQTLCTLVWTLERILIRQNFVLLVLSQWWIRKQTFSANNEGLFAQIWKLLILSSLLSWQNIFHALLNSLLPRHSGRPHLVKSTFPGAHKCSGGWIRRTGWGLQCTPELPLCEEELAEGQSLLQGQDWHMWVETLLPLVIHPQGFSFPTWHWISLAPLTAGSLLVT